MEDLARRGARPQNGLDPLRARPEPWFVGSGKGLMIGVVSLIAVLIGVRGLSTIWMAEEAWAWWRTHAASVTLPPRRAPREQLLPPGGQPAIPRSDEAN